MYNKKLLFIALALGVTAISCKKKGCTDITANNYNEEAKKDDGSCTYDPPAPLDVPSTYAFTDDAGNNTVSYSGQTDRLNQLEELTTYAKSGTGAVVDADIMKAMFRNTGDNGGGNFSFSSSKQLKNKCFATDTAFFIAAFDSVAVASVDYATTASNGQAGTLTSGTSTYLVAANGIEYAQIIDKGLMGAVFLNQALTTYFGSGKMDVDNTAPEDPGAGKYYTEMEHHWDEAFGYFGAPIDFPTSTSSLRFWAKYCNKVNDYITTISADIMLAFRTGRAAISAGDLTTRDAQITIIRQLWEKVSARQAVSYFNDALGYFGTDNAKYVHALSEGWAFVNSLKYVPLETRVISFTQITDILDTDLGDNFWDITTTDLNNAITSLNTIYNF
ncbi:MAG: DUF4856 domain-containing protein [Crocinitomicaceae bacterium]|nr:DUF4856 domain-containing protein [Crocinitomicaceae bacterium]